jgi:hypothetical protein
MIGSYITYNPKTEYLTVYDKDMDTLGEILKTDPQFDTACKDCGVLPEYAKYFIQNMESNK